MDIGVAQIVALFDDLFLTHLGSLYHITHEELDQLLHRT